MKLINNEIFIRTILKGNTDLFNTFVPTSAECQIGKEFCCVISDSTNHKAINHALTKIIFSRIPLNSSACGFVKNKSYLDFLTPHIKNYYFLRLDIKKFFYSIDVSLVENLAKSLFSQDKEGNKFSPYNIVMDAITHKASASFPITELRNKQVLPIGYPSSPVISNIIFRPIDILIQKYCEGKNIIYTRYADDMLFSANTKRVLHDRSFQTEIAILLSTINLKINKTKTIACENTISLNGYVIQNERPIFRKSPHQNYEQPTGHIRISNKKTEIIHKILHSLREKESPSTIMKKHFGKSYDNHKFIYKKDYAFFIKYIETQLQNKLKGYRSFLISLIQHDKKNFCIADEHIEKYSKLTKEIERYII
ncbi:Reverse transcriptase (RNA-dependent DNA polymerase) [Kosakonia oryzendophytica]|uniref:RNA-directed DNA polymerase n=1 Tax=Kosakonia oryzendophytica TaxID=1005665 RepID=A0A1C4A0L9_9ENTR|nr:reverse transcriptase family protein [Kosakonia oryzendophytica]SCB88095.1 Reverse transcriptase (RNA-dependent DNA polymerase) [Kosakonia oryzendophytica]